MEAIDQRHHSQDEPDLDQSTDSDKGPIFPESSTSRNPLSEIIESVAEPDPEQLERFRQAHQVAIDTHQKNKILTSAQAELDSRTPEGQQYAERLQQLNQPVSRLESIMARIHQKVKLEARPQCMDFPDAKKIVAELFLVKLARENKKLHFTEEQKEVVRDITAYFIGDPGSEIPLTKGIFLYGAVGAGKTILMDMMKLFCEVAEINNMLFEKVSTKSLVQEVADANTLAPIRNYISGHVFFDDLGEEKREVKLYGNIENPMDLLITERYQSFQKKGHFTHATSNLSPLELSLYGTRIFDRLDDMMHPVYLPGGSKRG